MEKRYVKYILASIGRNLDVTDAAVVPLGLGIPD